MKELYIIIVGDGSTISYPFFSNVFPDWFYLLVLWEGTLKFSNLKKIMSCQEIEDSRYEHDLIMIKIAYSRDVISLSIPIKS